MKKLLFVGTFLLFAVALGVNNVFAGSLDPEEVVENAYDALLQGDTEKYYNNVIDERFNSEEEAISFYDGDFNHDPLQSYEILNKEKQDDGSYKFTVKRTHKSGGVFQVIITVKEVNESWKLYISDEPLNDDDFEILESRDFNEDSSNDNTIQAQLKNWNFSMTNYRNTTNFTIPSKALILDINQQRLNNGTRFVYEVFGFYFDGTRSIGDREVNGSVTNYRRSLNLDDKPSSGYLRVWGNGSSSGALSY